jgi:hypothetical protein
MRTFPRREEGNEVRRPRQSRGRRRERSDRAHPPLSTRPKKGRSTELFNLFSFHSYQFQRREWEETAVFLGTKAIQIFKDGKGSNSPKAISRCGSSSVGRASAFQAEGRGFDPRFPLQFFGIQLVEISDHLGQPVLFN